MMMDGYSCLLIHSIRFIGCRSLRDCFENNLMIGRRILMANYHFKILETQVETLKAHALDHNLLAESEL